MERQQVLAIVESMPELVAQETERLKQMRNSKLHSDPSNLPVLQVERQSPVTPHVVTMSADLLIRNAALKEIGGCDNFADETNAKANIEEAKAKLYESGNMIQPEAEVKPVEQTTTKDKKATK